MPAGVGYPQLGGNLPQMTPQQEEELRRYIEAKQEQERAIRSSRSARGADGVAHSMNQAGRVLGAGFDALGGALAVPGDAIRSGIEGAYDGLGGMMNRMFGSDQAPGPKFNPQPTQGGEQVAAPEQPETIVFPEGDVGPDPQVAQFERLLALKREAAEKGMDRNNLALNPEARQKAQGRAAAMMQQKLADKYGGADPATNRAMLQQKIASTGPMGDLNHSDWGNRQIALAQQNAAEGPPVRKSGETKEEWTKRVMNARNYMKENSKSRGPLQREALDQQNARLAMSREVDRDRKAARMATRQALKKEKAQSAATQQFLAGLEPKDRAKLISDYHNNQALLQQQGMKSEAEMAKERQKASVAFYSQAQNNYATWLSENPAASQDAKSKKLNELMGIARQMTSDVTGGAGDAGAPATNLGPASDLPGDAPPANPDEENKQAQSRLLSQGALSQDADTRKKSRREMLALLRREKVTQPGAPTRSKAHLDKLFAEAQRVAQEMSANGDPGYQEFARELAEIQSDDSFANGLAGMANSFGRLISGN